MKKTLQFILTFILAIGIFIIPDNIAKAEGKEERFLNNYTFRIWNHREEAWSGHWGGFKFLDMGDGSVRIRPEIGGNIGSPS